MLLLTKITTFSTDPLFHSQESLCFEWVIERFKFHNKRPLLSQVSNFKVIIIISIELNKYLRMNVLALQKNPDSYSIMLDYRKSKLKIKIHTALIVLQYLILSSWQKTELKGIQIENYIEHIFVAKTILWAHMYFF